MCVYMHVWVCVCMCACTCVLHVCVHVHVCTCVCARVCWQNISPESGVEGGMPGGGSVSSTAVGWPHRHKETQPAAVHAVA